MMLGQQGTPDLVAGLLQLHVKVDPGLVGDGAVVGDDLQHMRRFEVVVIGIAEFFVNGGHLRGHLRFLYAMGDPAVPSIGFCGLCVELLKILEKLDSHFLALRHQLHVCSGIAVVRGVRTGHQLIDTVEMCHQSLSGQFDPPHRAINDDPGAAALKVFDLRAFSAMAEQHQLFKVQVQGLCKFDVVHAGGVDFGTKGGTLVQFKFEVVPQDRVGAVGLGLQPPGVGVDGVGQGQLAAQGPVGPPAWQPAANRGGPQRVEAVSQMPEHRAATGTPSGGHGAVHRVVGIPVAGFVQGDGLFIGPCARGAQAPLRWVVGQFDAIDATLADHEVAVSVSINVAIDPFGARLQAGQGYLVFVLIAPEALEGASDLLRGRHLQGARCFRHGAQLSPARGSTRGAGRRAGAGQQVHGGVDQ